MSTRNSYERELPRPSRIQVTSVTAALLALTGLIHVGLGLYGIGHLAVTGEPASTLDPLFLLAGVAIFVGMWVVATERLSYYRASLLGAGLMALMLWAYADWHAFEYTESALGLGEAGHSHDHGHAHEGSATTVLIDHLRGDVVALTSKAAELALIPLLCWLAYLHRPQ